MTYYHHNHRIYLVDREEPKFDYQFPPDGPSDSQLYSAYQDYDERWRCYRDYIDTCPSYECRVEGLKEGVVELGKDFVWQWSVEKWVHGRKTTHDFYSNENAITFQQDWNEDAKSHCYDPVQVAVAPSVVADDKGDFPESREVVYLKDQPTLTDGKVTDGGEGKEFQQRVYDWMLVCFGEEISKDVSERNHRFIEEALELVQATGATQSECHQLVDYVFGREVGEVNQEIGGVMVTLAALCCAIGQKMNDAGETELARIWTKVEKIRAKQAAKPKHSPLPIAQPPSPTESAEGKDFKQLLKRFVTDFALMIQEGQNIRKEYEYYERGNSVSIEKLMLLALPARQIAGDAWSEYDKQEESFKKLHDKATWVIAYRYALENNPSTTVGYSRADMIALIDSLRDYERENRGMIGFDERTSEELLTIHLNSLNK